MWMRDHALVAPVLCEGELAKEVAGWRLGALKLADSHEALMDGCPLPDKSPLVSS